MSPNDEGGACEQITALVLARDEERHVGDCLRSLAWTHEQIVLVDAATRDRTREIARQLGARVEERVFDDFAAQRQAALGHAATAWVLFVDADERVTVPLRDEILARLGEPPEHVGYWIPRENYLCGRLVRGGGWYPDYQLRLLRRVSARLDARRVVHEVAVLDGTAGYLSQPLIHLSYESVRSFAQKQGVYCALEAERWLRTYGRPRRRALVGQPLRELWRRLVVLRGYQEGLLGVALSVILAWYTGRAIWLARQTHAAPDNAKAATY